VDPSSALRFACMLGAGELSRKSIASPEPLSLGPEQSV
jgi:hypothetical protein